MIYLLNWRIWALVALLALGPVGYLKGRSDGRKLESAAYAAATAKANDAARETEAHRQAAVDEAARLATARANRAVVDAAHARAESDGLRDDLRAANDYAEKSRAAAERVAKLATELLASCSGALIDVSAAADRADNEARELRSGWPK